jgi:alpha-ketoglutarate-dependent taurine dioxygenase
MLSSVKTLKYGQGYGKLLLAEVGTTLDSLDKSSVMEELQQAGFIVFRNFSLDIESFSKLVQSLSVRVTLDPARKFRGAVAQKVDAGFDAVGLHCENGTIPWLPHLCWFFCEKAASAGSQTTVCDGYRVWDALSPATQQAFLSKDIVYSRNIESQKWKSFVFHSLQGKKPMEEIVLEDLVNLSNDPVNNIIRLHDDGSIYYAYRVPAAHKTLFGERIAFANSILGPSYNYEKPNITFVGDEKIEANIMSEIVKVTEEMTEDIEWQDGEVLLIDNTRVMHGRRAILDPDRTIYNALSYI